MIKKIIAVRNIGRLEECNAQGDVLFRKLTLLFAENGRGKTTLTDILRSLTTGNGDLVLGRQTLGTAFPPSAFILIETEKGDKSVNFKDGKWDAPGPRLAIYDSTFVHQNVYAGDHIDHDHKKNLYRVIVGEAGVTLARQVDEYDAKIRDANKDVNAKASIVKASLPAGMKLEPFLALPPDPEIATKIASKQAQIAALKKAKEIKEKPGFEGITVPSLPLDFEPLLAKELADVSKDAAAAVRKHLASHSKPGGEAWLGQGLTYANTTTCPFCGQTTVGIDLISDYQNYFSNSYTAFNEKLGTLRRSVEDALGDASLLAIQKTLSDNAALLAFWKEFADITLPELTFTDIQKAVANLRVAALHRLKFKVAAPLEKVLPGEEFLQAHLDLEMVLARAQSYADAVATANGPIKAKKKEMEGGSLDKANSELAALLAIQKRCESAVDAACADYKGALGGKNALDSLKVTARLKLDTYSENVVAKYEKRINQLLLVFGAGFRIGQTKTSYQGGTVSSSFQVVINKVPVPLGDAETPAAKPCFKNTLSAGDRSTLALAFFIAQSESDPKLKDTVVVFDDPFTSQDRSRRLETKQQICRLADSARQVIVFSHEPGFLKMIKDSVSPGMVRALQFMRLGEKRSTIGECDIDEIVSGDYLASHNTLHSYCHHGKGDPRLVVRAIRPLLEGYLRVKLPREFGPTEWLGDMIGKIRSSPHGSQLNNAKEILQELESINDYSKRYHHADSEAEPVDDGELQTFAARALAVVGGF
jgi:wobble nucleotide-excising tRNase